MKFIDEAVITVQSGAGGSGCVSFRREKFIPKGGPDGGDGGRGGDVILVATNRKRTLQHFQYKRDFKAPKGTNGARRQMTGKSGESIKIEVPVGTTIKDAQTGIVLFDLTKNEEHFVVARGGMGGQGNQRFVSSTHRSPRFAQPGMPGEQLVLQLELKLLADIGIIGLPNAGKSTLISVLSSARPKVADYPFTTLTPILGAVSLEGHEPFMLADIPGLIEGAHSGAGLGITFLKHIERTKFLVHLIDASGLDSQNILHSYQLINHELKMYSEELAQKPQIIVLNKLDIPEAHLFAEEFKQQLPDKTVYEISAATKKGVSELKYHLVQFLESFQLSG